MKRNLFLVCVLTALNFFTGMAQSSTDWKTKVLGRWKYLGVEQFGVETEPNQANIANTLSLFDDLRFEKKDSTVFSSGTYIINETAKTLTLKDSTTGKTKLFYLKKSDPGYLIIEFQTPDLIRTRYKYELIK
jgi:hypothetical protein